MSSAEEDFADLSGGDDVPLELPDAETLRTRVGVLEKQAGDYKMLIADLENSRKRLAADAERQRKYVNEPLVKDLLTALDNLDFAAKAAKASGDEGPLSQGVAATIQQFLDVLKRHGVARMAIEPGQAFDPNQHQAVMEIASSEIEPGCVVSVMQQGFMLHDRVIRPASVILAKSE